MALPEAEFSKFVPRSIHWFRSKRKAFCGNQSGVAVPGGGACLAGLGHCRKRMIMIMTTASPCSARALRCFSDTAMLPGSLASALCQSIVATITRRSYGTSESEDTLLVNQERGLGKITINRPKALNAKNCGTLGFPVRPCSVIPGF